MLKIISFFVLFWSFSSNAISFTGKTSATDATKYETIAGVIDQTIKLQIIEPRSGKHNIGDIIKLKLINVNDDKMFDVMYDDYGQLDMSLGSSHPLAKIDVFKKTVVDTANSVRVCLYVHTSHGLTEIKCIEKNWDIGNNWDSINDDAFMAIMRDVLKGLEELFFSEDGKTQGINLIPLGKLKASLHYYVTFFLLCYVIWEGTKILTGTSAELGREASSAPMKIFTIVCVVAFSVGVPGSPELNNATYWTLKSVFYILDGIGEYIMSNITNELVDKKIELGYMGPMFLVLGKFSLGIFKNVLTIMKVMDYRDFIGLLLQILSIVISTSVALLIMGDIIIIYLASGIVLYVLAYVSPLFVPTILFADTQKYFSSWLKAFLGSMLQIIVTSFSMGIILYGITIGMYGSDVVAKCFKQGIFVPDDLANCIKNNNISIDATSGIIIALVTWVMIRPIVNSLIPELVGGITFENLPQFLKGPSYSAPPLPQDDKSNKDSMSVSKADKPNQDSISVSKADKPNQDSISVSKADKS